MLFLSYTFLIYLNYSYPSFTTSCMPRSIYCWGNKILVLSYPSLSFKNILSKPALSDNFLLKKENLFYELKKNCLK
jgi:hypothetical protein